MKRLRCLPYLVVAVTLLLASLPCAAAASRVLKVGHEQNHPMVSSTPSGAAQGIMPDILEEVAQREGWTLEYRPCIWSQCLEDLESAEIDLLIGIAYTPERAQKFSYNQHTVISNWGLLYSQPGLKLETYADLNGKRLAVVKNDVYSNAFITLVQQFNIRCDLVYAENFREIFDMIDWGEVHGGVANRFFSLLNEKQFKVKATPIIFSPVSVQIAAPKGRHADILAAYDTHLEAMKKDPASAYHQALKRWLGIEGARYAVPSWLKWLGGTAIGASLVLVLFIGLLRREVHRKTADLSKLTTAVEQSANSVMITDTTGHIEYVNPRFYSLSGYQPQEVIGKKPSILKSGHTPDHLYTELWDTITSGRDWQGELRNKRKNGSLYWELCTIAPVRNRKGEITNFVAIKEDITIRKAQEEVLTWQANHDNLTGLHNRYYLETFLADQLRQLGHTGSHLSLLLVDVDNLKFINDTFGHDFGDQLLVEIGKRLRQAACADCLVARFLGDEFVLVPQISDDAADTLQLAQRVCQLMAEQFMVDGIEVQISAGIGVVTYPEDGERVDTLLRNAEAAMLEAKQRGRSSIVIYNQEFHARKQQRLLLEAKLHRALDNHEFSLLYQPQVCAASGTMVGVEALLRWNPADLQPIPPDQFIPILEETSLIVPVGTWVLEQACRQAVIWQQAGIPPMRMSVNISALQFQRGDFDETLRRILSETGLDPALLCLELTESMLLHDTLHAGEKLQDLRDLGVRLSLDDFGTGYSSLSYLSRLPVQELKVDRSFVHRLLEAPSDTAVVNTIIAMAQELGLELVAEGVENQLQQHHLLERGCPTIQGFLYSRPLTPDQLCSFAATQQRQSSQT